MNEAKRNVTVFLLFLLLALSFIACSETGYRNAIPKQSTALVSFDIAQLSGVNNVALLKALLHLKNVDDSGIDFSQKLYLFESADGNLGVCAKVQSADKLAKLFEKLGSVPQVYRGARFAAIGNSWIAGYTDEALLLMGPVPVAAQAEMRSKMAKYLQQDEDNSIVVSPMYAKLDSINTAIAMVAQAQALPEQFIAPLTIGMPKDADASQVLIAAEMQVKKGCLTILGTPFSFNRHIRQALQEASEVYRPIRGKYVGALSKTALLGMFVNVEGRRFLPLLQANKGLQVLLTGINQAIDLDNIIRSIDGDMAIVVPAYAKNRMKLSMAAQLAHIDWAGDIGYWKQSVPKGSRLTDWKKNAYRYTDGTNSFYFGTTDDLQFYSGSDAEEAEACVGGAKDAIDGDMQKTIIGERMVMIVNLDNIENPTMRMFSELLKPVFGPIHTIVYKLKKQ